jgi:type IV pilus assembly protein PilN
MIKINLFEDHSLGDQSAKIKVIAYVASIATCLIIAFSSYTMISGSVSELSLERDSLKSDLDTLMSKTKTVRDLEEKKKTLRDKLSLLAKLKKSKIGPVRVLDDLNQAVPVKVWLREVKENGGILKIKGRAMSNQDIALFMQNLQNSHYFSQVDLVDSRQMYYSKRTGMVKALADITDLQNSDFQADKRPTKQSGLANSSNSNTGTWSIRRDVDPNKINRKLAIEEANIKIKEFVLSTKVHYEGKLGNQVVENTVDQQKVLK